MGKYNYNKTNWIGGKTVGTADIMNNLEEGVYQAHEQLKNVNSQLEQIVYENDMKIEVKKHKNGTTFYLVNIKYDPNNPIKKSFSNNIPNVENTKNCDGEYPRLNAQRNMANFGINASGWYTSKKLMGIQIKDGVAYGEPTTNVWYTLGVKKDGTLKAYDGNSSNDTLINDGVINSFCFSIPIIENGQIVSDDILNIYSSQKDLLMNRQIIGQKANKDYVFLTCDGRSEGDLGLTIYDCVNILLDEGCTFAYNLDGGGSAQTIVNGTLINAPKDTTLGFTERLTGDILYFSNDNSVQNGLIKDIQKSCSDIMSLERIRSAKVEDMKNKFNNSIEISSNNPSIILNETKEGNAGVVYKKNGNIVKKANLKDDSFSVYDYVLEEDILKVSNDGSIATLKGIIGMFLTTSSLLTTDIDKIDVNGIYWINPNTTNIGNAGTGILLHMQLGATNNNSIQINFRMNASSQKRVCSNGVWGAWGSL